MKDLTPSKKRFRFKDKSCKNRDIDSDIKASTHHVSHGHESEHQRKKRRRVMPNKSSRASDQEETNYDHQTSADDAFRESLLDAMQDAEGAAFWQNVYGQPVHGYPNIYTNSETGRTEIMDDEQYAQYVRCRMWEKSAEGIEAIRRQQSVQEQQRLYETRPKKLPSGSNTESKQRKAKSASRSDIEASLSRGRERQRKKHWQQVWSRYSNEWSELRDLAAHHNGDSANEGEQLLRDMIVWPVESGRAEDISAERVRSFLAQAIEVSSGVHPRTLLKIERVRWHPDKIQQMYGFLHPDPTTLEHVTAVFQIIDDLWSEASKK